MPETTAIRNVRVLVLDDEEPIRRLAQAILTRAGCMVETAGDGREGLQILLQRDFDVAVVDLRMRDMGGSEFLEEARSIWPWMGIVILTGHADADAVMHARKFGVTRILNKPLNREMLVAEVMEEARGKRQRLEMTASHGLDHIQDQLGILRRFSEVAMAAESLDEGMVNLSEGLSNLFPCDTVGVLSIEGDQHRLYFKPNKPVSQQFLDGIEDALLNRYAALTGCPRPKLLLTIPLGGFEPDPKAPAEIRNSFTVPIISEGEVVGLLMLASYGKEDFSSSDVSFLYHAANQLSTVLAALNRMRQLSVRDTLTGLYNRKGLQEEYERAWQLSRRYAFPISVAVIDLDHFKSFNDSHGHPLGDEILKEFAELLREVARTTDIIGRYGGDEMVVVLQQAGTTDAITFGERLASAVRNHLFCEKTKALRMTTSIGVASSTPAHMASSADELLSFADRALYAAKEAGRDRVCIFQPSLPTPGRNAQAAANAASPLPRGEAKVKARVLVVDDELAVGQTLATVLRAKRYDVDVETSASAAIQRLQDHQNQFDVLLTDINMPDMNGLELLDRLRSVDDRIMKIVITGQATLDNALTSLRRGAYDFVEKPVQASHLLAVLDRALEYARLKEENRRYQVNLEEMVREKSTALREALAETRQSYEFTLEALVNMLDARETNTGQHSLRVRLLSVVMAQEMGLSQSEVDEISHGALLHDIGKIAIPDAILLKPGPLTPEEREIMKEHPDIGFKILSSSKYLERAAEIVRQHQEHYDGSGYPRGLKGDQICLGARIFAVVDTYDAMRSDRPYRKSLPPEVAIAEIRKFSGRQFDPAVVEAFVRCQSELEKAGSWPSHPAPVSA
jgi:diguanylate cyclase (GGDEF)-like protein/putative nucleotidyltransferase with HDIG domain